MAIREFLSSLVSRPAGRILEGSVRALVDDLIRDHDLASAAEVDSLRRSLRDIEARAERLQVGLAEARGQVAALEASLAGADARLAEARDALAEAQARLAAAPSAAPVTDGGAEPVHCQVEGCGARYRSKGFCSPHYQRWRRGTLPGFVRPDGVVVEGQRRWRLDVDLAGQPCTFDGDALIVAGKKY